MARDGIGQRDIARALQINRMSVTAHLAGDVTYAPDVVLAIRLVAPLCTNQWLTIRQAAPWIPGHPSMSRMRVLVTGRSWLGNKQVDRLRTRKDGNRLTTCHKWIRQFNHKSYPDGIWLQYETIRAFAGAEVAAAVPKRHFGTKSPMVVASLVDAERTCVALTGDHLTLPTTLVHRAVQIEARVRVAVV